MGKHVTDWRFVFEDDLEAVEELTSRQREGSEQQGVSKNRNYCKDGSVIYCEWYNSVLRDPSGKLRSVLSLVLDVSARKRAEEERHELLARERAARREAEEANRIKDEFLATLSHELRTPLTAIVGWSHLLVTGAADAATYSQAFETILRNAKSQGQLIEDLLDVSRIITGKLRLDARPVDIGAVIQAAVGSVRLAAQAKGIRLELVLDSFPSQVSGDPDRLQQVVWNLLSNAIKFTPSGGRVQVQIERVDSSVTIKVSDSGLGIKPEFLPYVFDRFRQAEAGTARQHRGLGLGLAIVRHLVELHGGMVQAASDGANLGSVFIVTLPLFVAPEHTVVTNEPEAVGHTQVEGVEIPGGTPRLDGLRVLVVDDEADSRQVISMILRRSGAETMTAGTVSQALEIWHSWKPDVLIADIGMPAEDGYSLIRRIRLRSKREGGQVPAVALTAYVRPEDRLRILSAGYQMHVGKPVDPGELISAVASVAKAKNGFTPPAPAP